MPLIFLACRLRAPQTDAEIRLWDLLRSNRSRANIFRRQHPIGRFIVDFACFAQQLAIEVDGGQHQEEAAADRARDLLLRTKGFRVLRLWNNDVLGDAQVVLQRIAECLDSPTLTPGPSPACAGEGRPSARSDRS